METLLTESMILNEKLRGNSAETVRSWPIQNIMPAGIL
jgi:hypothetical protein